MKIVATFYEPETEANYYEPLKAIRRICKEAEKSEFEALLNKFHSTNEYNKTLSFCWYLPDVVAGEIEAGWVASKYEYEY